ncbi:MAG TPA: PAS domain S-box protein [Candidatus Xenobia bacterium]|nr:PAS domain S-box protein [Candidatus Xenobia bacterium]
MQDAIFTMCQSEGYMRALIEAEPECVKLTRCDGTLLHINAAGLAMLEADSLEQVQGKSVYPLIAPEYLQAFQEFNRTVCGGQKATLEFEIVGLKGTRRWLESHAVPFQPEGEAHPLVLAVSHDITWRVQAEEALRLSEERFAKVFRSSPLAITISELATGRYVEANEQALLLSGYRREEVVGRSALEVGVWVDPAQREQLRADLARDGHVKNREYRFRRKSGEVFTCLYSAELIELAGKPHVLSIANDITERKQMEETLAESQRQLRLALEASGVGLWDWDVRTGALRVSPELKKQIGLGPNDPWDDYLTWERHLHPDDREGAVSALRAYLDGFWPEYDVEFRLRHKDGSYRWIRSMGTALRDGTGKPYRMLGAHVDITERKQAEEALRSSESSFRLLFGSNPLPMWVYSRKTLRFLEVNEAAIRNYGYSRDEFLQMTIADIRPAEDVDRLREELSRPRPALQHSGSWRHRLKDGRLLEVEIQSHTLPFAGEDAVLVVAEDVTERRQLERQQAVLHRVATATVETANLADLYREVHAAIQMVMPADNFYIALYDENRDVLSFPYFVDQEDSTPAPRRPGREVTSYVLRTGRSLLCTEAIDEELRRSGEIETVGAPSPVWLGVPLKVAGKTIGVMAVQHYSDPLAYGERELHLLEFMSAEVAKAIEHKKTEDELRLLQTAVEQSAEAIVITDANGAIEYANPAFSRIAGYERHEVLGRNPRILKSGRHDRAFYRVLWETITGGEVWRGEIVNRRRDGSLYTEQMTITPVRMGGEITHFIAIKEDVTERKKLQRQMQELQKFEALGQLAGGIAHDFNNALGAIMGWTDLALLDAAAGSPLRARLQKIYVQAERTAGLTRQLLAFARRQALEPRNLDLNQIIRDELILLETMLGKDVKVKVALADALPTVCADPTQIGQILMNLCVNARDAMPEGGELVVETREVEFDEDYCRRYSYARPGRFVQLAVSDTGVGMDAETQKHIFEPFFTTKEVGKGTGLGLATVYGIVKQHEGIIHVYSEPGVGTTFRVYLPVVQGAVVQDDEKPKQVERGGTETILLADDHDGLRETAQEVLETLGYRVLSAADGKMACEVFDQHAGEVELAILDVVMPEVCGLAVAQRIASRRPDVPVIFTTGYSGLSSLREQMEKGAEVLQKPYTPAVLARKVREALDAARGWTHSSR